MDNHAAELANERIVKILTHHEAYGREALANHIALKSNESLASAVAIMRASGRDRGGAPAPLTSAQIYAHRREMVRRVVERA
jgi:hypothetical protein